MAYTFYPSLAVDPYAGRTITDAIGQLYALGDHELTRPLTVRGPGGRETTEIPVDATGLTAEFECEVPYGIWVSGEHRIPLWSPHGMAARAAAPGASSDPAALEPQHQPADPQAQDEHTFGRRGLLSLAWKLAAIPATAAVAPIDVFGELQEQLNAQPTGSTLVLPSAREGTTYYLSDQLTVPAGVTLKGDVPQRGLRQGWQRGGAVFAPMPGTRFAPGKAVVACGGPRAQLHDVTIRPGDQADYAVLDQSTDSVHVHLVTSGGRVCSYDGSRAARIRLELPSIEGLGRGGSTALRLGIDSQMIGGMKSGGSLEFRNAHGQVSGAHLTGGAPNVDVQARGCQVTGCVLDSASGVALLRAGQQSAHFTGTGLTLHQRYAPKDGQVPAIQIAGPTGVISGCVIELEEGTPKLPYFIRFGDTDPSRWNVSTINAGNAVTRVWDRPPGHFLGVLNQNGVWMNSV